MATRCKNPVFGTCPLCLTANSELMDSHLLPKWMYRRSRESELGPARDPVMIANGVAIQTSFQVKERLLCDSCEQSFSPDEDYVSQLAYKADNSLGLLDFVSPNRIESARNSGGFARFALISDLKTTAIVRFAASMFWRYQVSSRFKGSGFHLWGSHAERLRLFLHERRQRLPSGMCIALMVLDDHGTFTSAHSGTFSLPSTGRSGKEAMHWFAAFGLVLLLRTDGGLEALCLSHGETPRVVFTDWQSLRLMNDMTEQIISATPKGGFAKRSSR